MADTYLRQKSLGLNIPSSVAVIGCGGVGSWAAKFLSMAGVPEIYLFDGDSVEEHNLNRLPLPSSAVSKPKSRAVAEMIAITRPQCDTIPLSLFTEAVADSLSLGSKLKWVIVTTDTIRSRRLVYKWATAHGVNYVEAAAEGEAGSATGMPAEWATPAEDNPGYASVPVWVGPCVTSAIIAVSHVVHGAHMGDRTIRLGWQDRFTVYDSEGK